MGRRLEKMVFGASGSAARWGRARRGLEAARGGGGRLRGRRSFRRLGFAARDRAGSLTGVLCPETLQPPTRRAEGLSPPAGRPRISSAYIAVPDDRPAHVRRKTSHPRAHPPSAAGGRRSLCFAGNHGDSGETG